MNLHHNQLEEDWSAIQSELSTRNFHIYPAPVIASEAFAPWPDDRPITEFLDFAEQCQRQVIYASAHNFDSDDALELLLLLATLDFSIYDVETPRDCLQVMGVASSDGAKEYVKLSKFYEGKIMHLSVQWVYEGVVHLFRRKAGWHEELEKLAGRLAEMADEL